MTIRSPGLRIATAADHPPPVAVPGKDGASISAGEGPPNEGTGKAGDLYIDAETGDLYRKEM